MNIRRMIMMRALVVIGVITAGYVYLFWMTFH